MIEIQLLDKNWLLKKQAPKLQQHNWVSFRTLGAVVVGLLIWSLIILPLLAGSYDYFVESHTHQILIWSPAGIKHLFWQQFSFWFVALPLIGILLGAGLYGLCGHRGQDQRCGVLLLFIGVFFALGLFTSTLPKASFFLQPLANTFSGLSSGG